jgi:hypothetical protein
MPADFGEITAYHHQEATRLYALAQEARELGCLDEADYLAGQAARWEEAALEQQTEMHRPPRQVASQSPFLTLPEEPHIHPLIKWPMAIVHGVRCGAAGLGQFIFKRRTPITSLSLR